MVFGPETTIVEGAGSAVTAQDVPVGQSKLGGVLEGISKVLPLAGKLIASGKEGEEMASLKNYEAKLANINQAILTGQMTPTVGRAKAYKIRDSAIANSGLLAKDLDKSFDAIFGGSGGKGGAISETPEEKASREHREKLAGLRAVGLSDSESENFLLTERKAELADSQAKLDTATEEDILGAAVAKVGLIESNLSLALYQDYKENGLLDVDAIREYTASIDITLQQEKGNLIRRLSDKGVTLSESRIKAIDAQLSAIKSNFSSRLKNYSEGADLASKNDITDARAIAFIADKFPILQAADTFSNQEAGRAFVDFMSNPDSKANAWLAQQAIPDLQGKSRAEIRDNLNIIFSKISQPEKHQGRGSLSYIEKKLWLGQAANPQVPASAAKHMVDIASPEVVQEMATADPNAASVVSAKLPKTPDTMEKRKAIFNGTLSSLRASKVMQDGELFSAPIRSSVEEGSVDPTSNSMMMSFKPTQIKYNQEMSGDMMTAYMSLKKQLMRNPDLMKEKASEFGVEENVDDIINASIGFKVGTTEEKVEALASDKEAARLLKEGGSNMTSDRGAMLEDLADTLKELLKDESFKSSGTEERLKVLEEMGYDGSIIRTLTRELYGKGSDKE